MTIRQMKIGVAAFILVLVAASLAWADGAPPAVYHVDDGPAGLYCQRTEWYYGGLHVTGRGRTEVLIQFYADHDTQGVGYDRWWWDGEEPVREPVVLAWPEVRPFSTRKRRWADMTAPTPGAFLDEHREIVSVAVTCRERGRPGHAVTFHWLVGGYPGDDHEPGPGAPEVRP